MGAAAPAADGATRGAYPLKYGSKGTRVCDAAWLMAGHKPSVYRGVNPVRWKVPTGPRRYCEFGRRMKAAALATKRELGYPPSALKPIFGRDLRGILLGERKRPIGYVVRATRRKAALARALAKRRAAILRVAANSRAGRMLAIARRECCGFRETWGPNRGPRVDVYTAITGTRGLPWCAAFLQYLRRSVGLPVFGFPAPAHVFTIVGAARARGLLRTLPRAGRWVAFPDRLGHIGIVERVVSSGFYTIEGNASDSVLRRFHPFANRRPKIFIVQPGTEGVRA